MRNALALPALIACVFASGCSSLWGAQAELDGVRFLDDGAPVQPPSGLVRMCEGAPEICASPLGEAQPATGGLVIGKTAAAASEVTFTSELWQLLVTVNSDVNWLIAPRTDEAIYGRREVWAMPLSRPDRWSQRGGDCEDYALEKRERLLAAGLPRGALQFAIGVSASTGRHTVLIVRTDRGDVVLDNMSAMPFPLGDAPYRWVSRQAGPGIMDWVSARTAYSPQTAEAIETFAPPAEAPGGEGRDQALLAAYRPLSLTGGTRALQR